MLVERWCKISEKNEKKKEQNNTNKSEETPDFSFIDDNVSQQNEKKKEQNNNIKKSEETPDFSFIDDNVSQQIDKAIDRHKQKIGEDEFKIEHVSDKIRFAKTIKENPPEKDFMKIDANETIVTKEDEDGNISEEKGVAVISYHEHEEAEGIPGETIKKVAVYNGLFSIDLNIDAYFWFVRACNIFPLILDQGIRTHLDIKRSHEPEKRRHELPIALIGAVIAGIILIFLIFNFVFKGG